MSARSFYTLDQAALALNLPRSWFRREVDDGRIPCINVGTRRMFDLDAVHRALTDRARPVGLRSEDT